MAYILKADRLAERKMRLEELSTAANTALNVKKLQMEEQRNKEESGGLGGLKQLLQITNLENLGVLPPGTSQAIAPAIFGNNQAGAIQPSAMPNAAIPQVPNFISNNGRVVPNPAIQQLPNNSTMINSNQMPTAVQTELPAMNPDYMENLTTKQQVDLRGDYAKGLIKADIDAATKYATNKATNKAEFDTLLPQIKSMYQEFNDALEEIKQKSPGALESGFEGWINRQGIKIGSSKFIDEYPKLAVLADNIKADATPLAKIAGELRPTDDDIQRFLTTILDPRERSLASNIAKAKAQKRRLDNKGVYTDWMDPLILKMENTARTTWKDMGNGIKIREVQ